MMWAAFTVGIVIGMGIGITVMGFVASATFRECIGSTDDAAFNEAESWNCIMAEAEHEENAGSSVAWAKYSVAGD